MEIDMIDLRFYVIIAIQVWVLYSAVTWCHRAKRWQRECEVLQKQNHQLACILEKAVDKILEAKEGVGR